MKITPHLVIGYHGCTCDVAEKIFSGEDEHLSPSANDYDWLGHGIYFWENDYQRAFEWAELSIRRNKSKHAKPAVVGAVILPNHCLDLIQQEHIEIVRSRYKLYKEELLAVGMQEDDMPKNCEAYKGDKDLMLRYLDCQVINYVHNNMEKLKGIPFDSVRAPFLEGKAIFKGSMLMEKTHIQLAIRSPKKCILGYFRPFKGLA